ncbi:EAL domain-containing protein [Neobacillus sp. MM2021_6]|uniref:putative bifunctional diguanylate cyclase/phosphodiesterase n=1 Tax=Bacillaceae TaxID=186817 RepID=UPI00140B67AF|nr:MULTISPECIES: GGDEF and EAL domain-containing protein [Bacillaceae]MBO0959753.1 EAL domain-containing protein [Neobacillus sp. MM2021_6]NHC19167.1 EAL domain-containing protein [Bacillus sp. MM2020_4]
MTSKPDNFHILWTVIFCIFVLIEIFDVTSSFLFPTFNIFRYFSVVLLLGTIPYLLVTRKMWMKTNEELKQNEQNLNNIFDTLDVAIWSHDLKSNTLLITSGIEKLYGYSSNDFNHDLQLWKKVIYPDDLPFVSEREQKVAQGEAVTNEYRIIRPDGEVRWILDRGFPTLDLQGKLEHFNSVLYDITERKMTEETIQRLAYHDSLTGLPNRNQFRNHLNKVLNRACTNKMLAVLFLDLDRFKIINDTKGHTVGDRILQNVANRLELAVREEGFVSRQGGDEFIILLDETDKEKAAIVAQRILYEFSKPLEVNNQEFFVTPSIGISLYPTDGKDEETLIKNADTAMYQAKERGKNNFQFYSSNLNGQSVRKMELENGLRKALENDQLTLHYQPQMSLVTGELVGIEALIRWQHPEHGFIAPSEFIPLAEETGLIVPIGKWVLWNACQQRKAWENAGLCDVPIAVNVSVRQFEDDHLIEYISTVLDEVGLNATQLELEITESIMQNLENSTIILNQLKELGVWLSIDDFGTGYSSLSYLKYLPIDKIKIDKSFVDDILYHSNQGVMVKTIIDMGLNLNFTVIAEGIETDEQLSFLKENACKVGQGYLFSKPLPTIEMQNFLINRKSGILL